MEFASELDSIFNHYIPLILIKQLIVNVIISSYGNSKTV